jgi:hypothetical protein
MEEIFCEVYLHVGSTVFRQEEACIVNRNGGDRLSFAFSVDCTFFRRLDEPVQHQRSLVHDTSFSKASVGLCAIPTLGTVVGDYRLRSEDMRR